MYRLEEEFRIFRDREEAHRDTNESTNSRIPTLSVLSIVVLVICGGWQLMYLRNFFRKAKLL